MACPNCDNCKLYEVIKYDESSAEMISDYCLDEENFKNCERYKKMDCGDKVPPTLLPNGKDLRDKKT